MSIFGDLSLPMQVIEIPKWNDGYLTFTTRDKQGVLVDIAGTTEISFAVWDGYPSNGGVLQFQKTLSGGDIVIQGDNNRFSVWVSSADTSALDGRLCYYECEMTNSAGRIRTGSAGLFRAENTYTGAIV